MEKKSGVVGLIGDAQLFLLGLLFIFFPLVFTSLTTNPLLLPKVALLALVVFILLLLSSLSLILEKSVKIRRTYFDIPIVLFLIIVFLSSIFAVNKADSLMAFVPLFFVILLYFLTVNKANDNNSLLFLISCLTLGGVILSIFSILTYFKIYILPIEATHSQGFSLMGSLLDQAIYLSIIFLISTYYTLIAVRANKTTMPISAQSAIHGTQASLFGIASIILLISLIITIIQLTTTQKPAILPLQTGFQTAFAQISLDTGRIFYGFLFGSGLGTYFVDFTRFKQATFNQGEFWNMSFFRSSSFVLELLATTGVLGLTSFGFLLVRILKEAKKALSNPFLLSIIGYVLISLFLPFGFINLALMFIVLALFAGYQSLVKNNKRFFDVEIEIVAFKKGLISLDTPTKGEKNIILPAILSTINILIVAILGFFSFNYIASDIAFQKSLVPPQNNAQLIYNSQRDAIAQFPYRDSFHRIFSQTNLAIASALAQRQQQDNNQNNLAQQDIINLIQQSINSARSATNLAPQTYLNWQNLSSVYRSLIGFGQNAQDFAIATARQSINLDPNNPQQYIYLGGLYYQLQQWDNAQNQFLIATRLKPDFANAYYNLGHALEEKGDLQNAMSQYEIVKRLVANDKNSLDVITNEIASLNDKINSNATVSEESEEVAGASATSDQQLNIDTPKTTLPPKTPQVKIPAPDVATKSSR